MKSSKYVDNQHIGMSWEEFEQKAYTKEELQASDLRVAIISEIIKARQEMGYTQRDMEKMSYDC